VDDDIVTPNLVGVEVGDSIVLVLYVDVPVRWLTPSNFDPAGCVMQVAPVISELDVT
jgi:hypothetical protein